jgi:hypothetical protein
MTALIATLRTTGARIAAAFVAAVPATVVGAARARALAAGCL